MRSRHDGLARAAVAAVCLVAAMSAGADEGRVVVGSKAFTESRVLGELMAQMLEARTTLKVERRFNLGGTMIVFSALQSGDIDVYAEYTGTAWTAVLHEKGTAGPLETFTRVQQVFRLEHGLRWLAPFGFSNSYALAVPTAKATQLGISRISDLKKHPSLRYGFSHEFTERSDGWHGVQQKYGLQAAGVRAMEHSLLYTAVGAGEVDVFDTYTTDAKLADGAQRVLVDDQSFFPPYDAAPVVRAALLSAHPEIDTALSSLSFRITNEKMQALNAAVELGHVSYADAARDFLTREGLLSSATAPARALSTTAPARGLRIGTLLWRHIWLTALAVFLACLLGVPLGLMIARRRRAAEWVVGAAGVVQTVPSLALLALLIPLPGFGLGARSAIFALFLYALLPILRNAVVGIQSVDPVLVDAARALGMTARQRLWHVEFPLARPTVLAGIRTAAVTAVGVATLAAFVGAGGLGEAIITGLQLNDPTLIIQGALPAAGLAIALDIGLGALQRRWAHT